MGEHKFNPVAQAHRSGSVQVPIRDIGAGYGLIGIDLLPMIHIDDETGVKSLAIMVVATGGKPSQLAPMQPVNVTLGEIARLPLTDVYKGIDAALAKAREAEGS